MRRSEPIEVLPLFPEVRGELLSLLASLAAEEWERPTACALWPVKDVALHLLRPLREPGTTGHPIRR